MKSIFDFDALYIHRDPVDFRKSINGLGMIVQEEMKKDLRSSSLFVFCNRRRTHMKILYFDKSGFAIWYKRLEESKFPWPKHLTEEATIQLSAKDLEMLLDGVNIWTRFKNVHFERLS